MLDVWIYIHLRCAFLANRLIVPVAKLNQRGIPVDRVTTATARLSRYHDTEKLITAIGFGRLFAYLCHGPCKCDSTLALGIRAL